MTRELTKKEVKSITGDGYQIAKDRHFDGEDEEAILGCCPDAALAYEDDEIDPDIAADYLVEGVHEYFKEKSKE